MNHDKCAASMNTPVLELVNIRKRYGAVMALVGVDLCLRSGEVHALMGQNGAGKSTLIKVLTGVVPADGGSMLLDGIPVAPTTPLQAQQLGISTVYQEANLCPNLSVAENIFAGRYPRRSWRGGWLIDRPRMRREAELLLGRLALDIDVRQPLAHCPMAVQQLVAIARAVSVQARVLILDEPTSSLDEREVQKLYDVMRHLRAEGMAILFVTHFLDQVYAMADRITVLRNGAFVQESTPADLPPAALVAAMVGRDVPPAPPRAIQGVSSGQGLELGEDGHDPGAWLEAQALQSTARLAPVSLRLRAGEVVGMAGLLGSGRTEVARLLYGLDRARDGRLWIQGEPVQFKHPRTAVARGLAFCPEERKTAGILGELSVRENIVLALQLRRGWWRTIPLWEQRALAEDAIRRLGIKTGSTETLAARLSGGNQQKVLLARWLVTKPGLLIVDEPTRGIDVAAKMEVMNELRVLAEQGMAVLFISSELEEVIAVSHRVLVMRNRALVAECAAGVSEAELTALISEVSGDDPGGGPPDHAAHGRGDERRLAA